MRSVQLLGKGVVACIDTPNLEPGPGQVLVETRVSAICGSEMKAYRGKGIQKGNSGHEAAGIVAAIGPGVTNLQEGQRVGISAISGCGECSYCAQGKYTWCNDRTYNGDTHAEQFVAQANACHKLPDDVSWDVGVLITGDGFGVPYHTSTKLKNEPVECVAIFGMGPIGLGNTLMQTHLGREIIAVDVSVERIELARELGAAHVINASKTNKVTDTIRQLTNNKGPDVCIEAAGRPETAKQCFQAVRTGGTVVFNGEQGNIELSPSNDFIRRDITALGSWYYHFYQFSEMLKLFRNGLGINRLITHHFSIEEADEAFQLMSAGRTGKVILQANTN